MAKSSTPGMPRNMAPANFIHYTVIFIYMKMKPSFAINQTSVAWRVCLLRRNSLINNRCVVMPSPLNNHILLNWKLDYRSMNCNNRRMKYACLEFLIPYISISVFCPVCKHFPVGNPATYASNILFRNAVHCYFCKQAFR